LNISSLPAEKASVNGTVANPWSAWSARSAWPGHPAILPPLPRVAKSEALATGLLSSDSTGTRSNYSRRREQLNSLEASQLSQARSLSKKPSAVHATREVHHRDTYTERKLISRATRVPVSSLGSTSAAVAYGKHPEPRQWPSNFDDWMMDIVRRRALRLNSGARRRGVHGSVRAVDLAHILDRSADPQGRWRCALCHNVVTLDDLSFDHVVALADGGEHAAYNLVPAHRKCNEVKGSEKAQYRAQALDRWLSEWAGTTTAISSSTPSERRYA
jgi:5-methylcytosine-specific restriction endonuclease McrA